MKKAIIIGATSGIGKAVASLLVKQGWTVAVTGRRYQNLLSLRYELGCDKVLPMQMDVTEESSVEVLDSIIEQMGAPDLFLYVSGIGRQNPELDIEVEVNTIKTNCEGMVRLVDHFINYVKGNGYYTKKNPAHVAVVTSVAGTKGMGAAPAYSATKKMQSTYLSALVQYSHMEKVPVKFSDIRPGFVATDILNPMKNYPMLITREKAAQYIVRGLKRKKRVIIFDWKFKAIVILWNLIPNFIWERLSIVKN